MPTKLELTLPAGPQAASAARVAFEDLEPELDSTLLKDLCLMVSELVTNSIRHASSDPRDVVELRAWLCGDRVRIEVSDGGPEFTPVATRGRGGEVGGWGLFIVDSLADRWGVERRQRRNCVWVEIDVPERRTPVSNSAHDRTPAAAGHRGGGGTRRRARFADERNGVDCGRPDMRDGRNAAASSGVLTSA